MPKFESPLDNIKVASPCSANWEDMFGNERKRFCGECKLNVYNLSGMTRYDAENLLTVSEGRLCVRYFQRSDGTILSADCPVGWAKVKQRLSVVATAVFSMLLTLLGGLATVAFLSRNAEAVKRLITPIVPTREREIMGNVTVRQRMPTEDSNKKNLVQINRMPTRQ